MPASITDLIQLRASMRPDAAAYVFLPDQGTPESITYRELAERSALLAAAVASSGGSGDRVLLLFPPGIDYVVALFACLHAGRVAVPAYPPHPARLARTLPRLEAICADADAAVALASAALLPLVDTFRARIPRLSALRWLAADAGAGGSLAAPNPHEVAILQYTSGSTADPRGVLLGHDNLLHNLEQIRRQFSQTPETRGVFWLPPYHDMGLVGGILEPLYAGYPSVLMSPESFLARPACWLEAIERYEATTSGGPNFAYDLCVRKTLPQERARLDLHSWTVAFNGAEPVRADTLERFAAAFAGSGFRRSAFLSCYGLAEATLLVASTRVGAGPVVRPVDRGALGAGRVVAGEDSLVSCGSPAEGLLVKVVDRVTGQPVPDGTVGEVWVSGPSVARGYWRRPGDPAFAAVLTEHPGRAFLRTGDLGAWVQGELVIAGREKDVVVVRGRNIFPQDLELAAERAHPAVRPGGVAAFAGDEVDGGDPRIVIVCEIERGRSAVDAEAVGRAVRRAVAEDCELPVASVVLVEAGAIPKTSSGKVRRAACRAELSSGALPRLAESRGTVRLTQGPGREQVLAAPAAARAALVAEVIVAAAARRGAPHADAGGSLLDLVPDSLGAAELASDLHAALGVEVELAEVLGDVPVAALAARVAQRMDASAAPPPAADPGVLSPGQSALWLVQQLAPSSTAYNLAAALRLHGPVDPAALERAVARVGERHAQLRIAVAPRDGRPCAVPAPVPRLERVELSGEAEMDEAVARLAGAPFDLERGPLWRVAWLDLAAPVLVLCAHHLVADYASLYVILDDLEQALRDRPLPTQHRCLAELTAVGSARNTTARVEACRAFWAAELNAVPVLDLPTPGPRPARPTHRGTQHEAVIADDVVQALRALAHAERTTLHVVLLAGVHALLHRWTGQEDVVVGTPVTARLLSWTRDLVGYCVNPLPVRAHPRGGRPFADLVREVRDRIVTAVRHELPFPTVVEAVGVARDAGRTPVFQAMFAFEKAPDGRRGALLVPMPGHRGRFAGVDAEPLLVRPSHVGFDLAVLVEESPWGVAVAVQVRHDALPGAYAARFADQWMRLLGAAARSPETLIGRLPLLSPEERVMVVHGASGAVAEEADRCLPALVAAQAERTPDADAVVDEGGSLSYRELVARAAALASHLRARGVGPETRVGVYTGRDREMVVTVLGILAAGGAYVYLDPRHPPSRVAFVISDAQIPVVVTRDGLAAGMPATRADVVVLEEAAGSGGGRAELPDSGLRPENLAYVIYTSGSTGQPKGVAIEHRAAASLALWAHREYGESLLAGTLASTSLAFDLSVFELFAPLTCGGSVIIADSALDLPRLPARSRVTLINTVPSAMTELVGVRGIPPGVRAVNLAGEPLTAALAADVHGLGHVERLYNLYGPTEDTTYSTFERVERGAAPTLGRSLPGRAAYVLDREGEPVPVGVVGEICLGGGGVARGYLHQPGLTAERFVPSALPEAPGRLYRTGDLGRRLADGRIEYLGRRDRQVKVRGFRIELEEVVAALVAHPSVAQAAVSADAGQRLVAHVGAPHGVDARELRAHLEARLPAFMVPNRITVLERLPLTPNGKVDHQALAAAAPPAASPARTEPATPTEAALVEIWREILGVEAGVADNFFALGGHSLLAVRLHARVRERFGVDVSLPALFEQPTIERLARAIESGAVAAPLPSIRPAPRGLLRFEDLHAGGAAGSADQD